MLRRSSLDFDRNHQTLNGLFKIELRFRSGHPEAPNSAAGVIQGRYPRSTHRSTFRNWGAERVAFPREVAEAVLAHAIGDKVEAAYRRGDLFEKRCRLMDEWARFCSTPVKSGKILPIRGVSE